MQSIIKFYSIKSVLDIGHGNWAMWSDYKFEDVRYIGIDIAVGLFEKVSHEFASSNRSCFHTSVFKSGLPKVDLVISEEVL